MSQNADRTSCQWKGIAHERDWYRAAIALMWLGLPINAWSYWQAWEQLPARMAVHFDANWQPNGYTSREGAMMLGLGIMAVMLLLFTVAGLIARAMKPVAAFPMLIVFYVVLGFLWFGNHSIVDFNLRSRPARSELVGPFSRRKVTLTRIAELKLAGGGRLCSKCRK